MNPFARLPLCGLISQYNATQPYGVRNFRAILVNRIRVQRCIVLDFAARLPRNAARREPRQAARQAHLRTQRSI